VIVRYPPRRPVLVVGRNVGRHLFGSAFRSWVRNLGGTAPALGSMTLLLLLAGLVGLTAFSLQSLAGREASDAAVLHVYLRDDAKAADVTALGVKVRADHRVASVSYTTKLAALRQAAHRPGLSDLAGASGSNPFPASLDLKLRSVQDVGAVAASVKGQPAVDPILSTSYDPGAYGRLQAVLTWLGIGGGVFLALLALVAVMVTANSIRAAIHARREEVQIMQLVGAPRWMVRAPFMVEGALTGGAAGLVAAVVVLVAALVAAVAGGRFEQLIPGLTLTTGLVAAAAVLLTGLALGSGSSLISIHRHLET
jgi:cell division transport system permease protein